MTYMPSNLNKDGRSIRSDWDGLSADKVANWKEDRLPAWGTQICNSGWGSKLRADFFSWHFLLSHCLSFVFMFLNPHSVDPDLGKAHWDLFFFWLFTWQLQFRCLDLSSHVEDCLVFLARLLTGNNHVETAIMWLESNTAFQV